MGKCFSYDRGRKSKVFNISSMQSMSAQLGMLLFQTWVVF